ncbi:hypothetical protein C0J50_11833, partial [Silurus asotus]
MFFFLSTGSAVCSVFQTPPDLIKNLNEIAEIKCAHNVSSYNQILWYKHIQDTRFTFMGYILATSLKPEAEFETKIKLSGDGSKNGSLTIASVSVNDSAVYYCAAYYT